MDDDALVARLRAAGCVFAEDEAALLHDGDPSPAELEARTARRVAGEPLELVLGWVAFAGLRVGTAPGVFVPRRRSELLVAQASALLAARPPGSAPAVVVDLCCGTGAVGLAVAAAARGDGAPAELHVADLDPAATACAAANLAAAGEPTRGRVHTGDLFSALPVGLRGRVDLLAVNAPYVPSAGVDLMPREAREHEPRHALDGGDDGLDLHRAVALGALGWLAPGGALVLETSEAQVTGTLTACRAGGLRARAVDDPSRGAVAVVALAQPSAALA